MEISRRAFCSGLAATSIGLRQNASGKVVKYVRYENRCKVSYGVLDGDSIREIRGDMFGSRAETGVKVKLAAVKLLWPCEPTKVLAVGLNFKSHPSNPWFIPFPDLLITAQAGSARWPGCNH